jgi:hypothetical protein
MPRAGCYGSICTIRADCPAAICSDAAARRVRGSRRGFCGCGGWKWRNLKGRERVAGWELAKLGQAWAANCTSGSDDLVMTIKGAGKISARLDDRG